MGWDWDLEPRKLLSVTAWRERSSSSMDRMVFSVFLLNSRHWPHFGHHCRNSYVIISLSRIPAHQPHDHTIITIESLTPVLPLSQTVGCFQLPWPLMPGWNTMCLMKRQWSQWSPARVTLLVWTRHCTLKALCELSRHHLWQLSVFFSISLIWYKGKDCALA